MQQSTKKHIAVISATLAMATVSRPALAFDWDVQTTVSVVEGSYVPSLVPFEINVPAGTCARGAWLYWTIQGTDEAKQIANAQAVFSLLLTAKMSNKTIEIYGYNSGCAVAFIHLVN